MMNHRMLSAVAFAAMLAPAALADEEPGLSLTIGDPAPPIDIAHWIKGVNMDGSGAFTPITEFEEGKVYVLEFWATWCGPCVASMPHLSGLQERYKDYDVKVIGISDETLPKVVSFLFQQNKSDELLQNDRTNYTLTTDPDQSVKNDYFKAAGRTGIPSAFIIGKDGHVEWIGHPMQMDEPLDAVVRDSWDRAAFRQKYETNIAAQREMMNMRAKLTEAVKVGDWDAACALLDEQIEKYPDNFGLRMQKFELLLTKANRPEQAYTLGRQLVNEQSGSASSLNQIAWTIADDEGVAHRDLDLALQAATLAKDLTDAKDPAILDTLARVYYEKGELKEAVRWQRLAAEYAGDNSMGEGIRAALEKYEQELAKR